MRSPLRTTLDNAGQLHASIVALPSQTPTVDRIIRAYARMTDTRIEDLAGPSKAPGISLHRHRLMYLIRRIDPIASYDLIGRYLGGRDMSTIHEAVAKIAAGVEEFADRAAELESLQRRIVTWLAGEPPAFLATIQPWQLLAACQILRDDQMTDAEARKAALSFLQQLEAAHG